LQHGNLGENPRNADFNCEIDDANNRVVADLDKEVNVAPVSNDIQKSSDTAVLNEDVSLCRKQSAASVVTVNDGSRIVYVVDTNNCQELANSIHTVVVPGKDQYKPVVVVNAQNNNESEDSKEHVINETIEEPGCGKGQDPDGSSVAVATYHDDKAIVNEITKHKDEVIDKKRGSTKALDLPPAYLKCKPVVDELSAVSVHSRASRRCIAEDELFKQSEKVDESRKPTGNTAPKPEDFIAPRATSQSFLYQDGTKYLPISIPDILPIVTAHSVIEESMSFPASPNRTIYTQKSRADSENIAMTRSPTYISKSRHGRSESKRKVIKVIGIPVETISEHNLQNTSKEMERSEENTIHDYPSTSLKGTKGKTDSIGPSTPTREQQSQVEGTKAEELLAPTSPGSKSKRTFSNKILPTNEVVKKHERTVNEVMKALDDDLPFQNLTIETGPNEFCVADEPLTLRSLESNRSMVETSNVVMVMRSQSIMEASSDEADPLFNTIMAASSSSSQISVKSNGQKASSIQYSEAQKLAKEAINNSDAASALRDSRRKSGTSSIIEQRENSSHSSSKQQSNLQSVEATDKLQPLSTKANPIALRKQFLSAASFDVSKNRQQATLKSKGRDPEAVNNLFTLSHVDDDSESYVSYRTAPLPSTRETRLSTLILEQKIANDDRPSALQRDPPSRVNTPSAKSVSTKPDPPKQYAPGSRQSSKSRSIAGRIRTVPAANPETDIHETQQTALENARYKSAVQ
jgi:hypothetical protein